MCLAFRTEDDSTSPLDFRRELAHLESFRQRGAIQARDRVTRIRDKSERFMADSRRMRRFVCGLDVTRVTCRIETGWLPDHDGGFHDIITKLDSFHDTVERRMKRIDALNDIIVERASILLNRQAHYKRTLWTAPTSDDAQKQAV